MQACYAQAADDADAEAFGSMFAEDGEIVLFGESSREPKAMGDWLRQSLTRSRLRHLTMNPGASWPRRYRDTYVRTTEGWKIGAREIIPITTG